MHWEMGTGTAGYRSYVRVSACCVATCGAMRAYESNAERDDGEYPCDRVPASWRLAATLCNGEVASLAVRRVD